MDLRLIARVLRERRRLQSHERWDAATLATHRDRALTALRQVAANRSPFYARFHRGLHDAPLDALPVLTKHELMASFDEVSTDRDVRLAGVRTHLERFTGSELYLGKYRVARTAGTTGHPGIFLADAHEWSSVIASYERAQRWAGIHADVFRRTRLAVVSSRVAWHQSAQVGLSVDSPIVPVRRFDALQPLADIVAGLNEWQPENLVAYASMAKVLADEQIAGRLRIAPAAVMCASEVLTTEMRARITAAWGREPFNVYAATEPAGIASECDRHRLHLYDDLLVTEVVDEHNRPVPPGTFGAKVLVSVLWSRTMPLIRYELSDSVAVSNERCDCGLPFPLLETIQGREEDFVYLPSDSGATVAVHPNVFHGVLEPLPLTAWQVEQEPNALRLRIVGAPAELADTRIADAIERALTEQHARPISVVVERVDRIERTALGKFPLVKALRPNA